MKRDNLRQLLSMDCWKNEAIYQEGLGAMLVDADFDETTPYVPKEPKLFQS
jgi:hypothetical protein